MRTVFYDLYSVGFKHFNWLWESKIGSFHRKICLPVSAENSGWQHPLWGRMWAEVKNHAPLCLLGLKQCPVCTAPPTPLFLLFVWQWNKVSFAIYLLTFALTFLRWEFSKIFLLKLKYKSKRAIYFLKKIGEHIFLILIEEDAACSVCKPNVAARNCRVSHYYKTHNYFWIRIMIHIWNLWIKNLNGQDSKDLFKTFFFCVKKNSTTVE